MLFCFLLGLWAGWPFGADGQSRGADEAAQRHYWLRFLTPAQCSPVQPSHEPWTSLEHFFWPRCHLLFNVFEQNRVNLARKMPPWNQISVWFLLASARICWVWDRSEGNWTDYKHYSSTALTPRRGLVLRGFFRSSNWNPFTFLILKHKTRKSDA